MLSWFQPSLQNQKANFESVQYAIQRPNEYYLINTLPIHEQFCLIQGTLDAHAEEQTMNDMLYSFHTSEKKVIVYGKNADDESIWTKSNQLRQHGLRDVYVYSGGMFEWLLLQDIYGDLQFPTTSKQLDILRYKSSNKIS
jgi:rhodanese-related sulfurtransferase